MRRARGRLRIIGGRWRGRLLEVPETLVRPTPDRVRETLFNWLAPVIDGARCVDAFAGSGALGLEALSRGAAQALLIEQDAAAADAIERNIAALQAGDAQLQRGDARARLSGALPGSDLLFLDPPFGSDGLADLRLACAIPGGPQWVYYETAQALATDHLPAGWQMWRSGRAGQVQYHLLRRIAGSDTVEGGTR